MTHISLRRLYRVRWLTATSLCLPALLIVLWYCWNAYERFDSARRMEQDDVQLTWETFQIHVHDLLTRDYRRLSMEPPPQKSSLDVFTFHIDQENLDVLERGVERDSGRDYAKAKLEVGKSTEKVQLRLRGQRYWHMGVEQKSVKVRLPKGKLLKGHRVFNLINDPSPMVVGEQLILDLARERGVLTPLSGFARVRLNATDLGVFHFETQPDESLLRTNRRVPGSIYSGDLSSKGDSWELWKSAKAWKKPASRTDDEEVERDFSELERLLGRLREANFAEFAEFVRHEFDLEKFALFDSIDVAFGGNRHNFRQNQKYAFDPYRGRWEPIAWSFEGFRDDPNFNLVEHPLLIRLKMTPGYLTLRDRLLYELLVGDASFPSLEQRGAKELAKLAPELRTDPFWDAYRLLSRVDRYHRRMVRPMTMKRAALVFESELTTYQQRTRQLLRELVKNPLYSEWRAYGALPAVLEPDAEPPAEVRTSLDLYIDGRAGARLESLGLAWPSECGEGPVRLLQGERELASGPRGAKLDLASPIELTPTVAIVAQPEGGDAEGKIRTEILPEYYPLLLVAPCAPSSIQVQAFHLATGTQLRSQPVTRELRAGASQQRSRVEDVPKFQPGEVAPHRWEFSTPTPEVVQLGPGLVDVRQTRVFGTHQRVEVRPGTHFKMAAKASLIFLGPVQFNGTADAPIVIDRSSQAAWGGIALQGKATEGSRLRHVRIAGGQAPSWRSVSFPAMVNLHDTANISIESCQFGENSGQGDVVHAAYVDGLTVANSRIRDASRDAWDLEFTRATMWRLAITNVGDDAMDLMGSRVVVKDSTIVGVQGNGISAGEESQVQLRQVLVADAKVGVLAKNASDVDLFGTVLYQNTHGVRVYERTVRYEGASSVRGDALFAIQTKKKPVKRDDRKRNVLDYGRARSGYPPPGVLDSLLHDVLGLESWDGLDSWSERERGGSVL